MLGCLRCPGEKGVAARPPSLLAADRNFASLASDLECAQIAAASLVQNHRLFQLQVLRKPAIQYIIFSHDSLEATENIV